MRIAPVNLGWIRHHVLTLLVGCTVAQSIFAATLIEGGRKTEWRFLDDGSDPGIAWCDRDFDDAKWRKGAAPLGYGESDITTAVRFGRDENRKHITTYFRREFQMPDPNAGRQFVLLLRADDGAAVHINGKQVARLNLPASGLDAKTPATRKLAPGEEEAYQRVRVPADVFVPGRNVIAAEVHQSDSYSSDLFFDLVVKSYAPGEEPVPARLAPAARDVALTFRERNRLDADARIPDGYVDGGHASVLGADGSIRTQREVMVVDRTRDAVLQRQLAYARSPLLAGLPPLERATLIALYVDREYSDQDGRRLALRACQVMEAEYRGMELLIGRSAGAGVCRHRALVFKLLADEANLSASLVRGHLGTLGYHAWNELRLENGEIRIVDVANPRPGFHFPRMADAAAREYRTEKGKPYYPVPESD